MINKEIVAEELYTAYCKAVGGLAFNGDPLPDWKTFAADVTKKKQSDAWLAAAERAMEEAWMAKESSLSSALTKARPFVKSWGELNDENWHEYREAITAVDAALKQ